MLTKGGWATAIGMAATIVLCLPSSYILLPIIFLILGSLVSRLNDKKSSRRTAIQVWCNGGNGFLCALLYQATKDSVFLSMFILSYGVALSDTFSSEIGRHYGGQPVDILKWKKVPTGLSGGITLIGSLGGLLGAAIVGMLGYALFQISIITSWNILIFSFLGMLCDSLLGSIFQAKYMYENEITESHNGALISGFRLIDNNMVNIISIFITIVVWYIMK